ncbi:alternate signal-mediated exported protein [Marisediminicola sp. UYEF4]|uniref:alternate-type signal peptide domain-containing protein n=1 Tax=Marisediminicola sp. UYEF4 TaxID=1756384 RepID=UPI003393C061
MNKLLKGSVAGAAGVALLLGGAGSFALWNSTESVNVGSVASGTLSIAQAGTPTWMDVSADKAASAIDDISTFKVAPGDTIELTQVVEIDARGNNLRATLSYDELSLAAVTAADKALLDELVITLDAAGGTNVTRIGSTETFAVTPATSTSTVTLTVTIEFPDTVTGATNGTVDFSALAFKLQQNDRL